MKWDNEKIREALLASIKILGLDRMPTGEELKSIGRNDLHCKVSRTKKYSGWAKELGLELKSSNTKTGQKHEGIMHKILSGKGYRCESMTTLHPYDLLINESVKIDIKTSNPYLLKGKNRTHTFSLNKIKPTCDIYILVALDESGGLERIFVIPSHFIQQKMVSLGKKSKYNKFVDRWDYIQRYSDFFKSID